MSTTMRCTHKNAVNIANKEGGRQNILTYGRQTTKMANSSPEQIVDQVEGRNEREARRGGALDGKRLQGGV